MTSILGAWQAMGMKAMAMIRKAFVMILALGGSSSSGLTCDRAPPDLWFNNLSAVLAAASEPPPDVITLILAMLLLLQLFNSVLASVNIPKLSGPIMVESLSTRVGPPMVPLSFAMAASSKPRSARIAVLALNCCASSGEGDHHGSTSELNGEVGSRAHCRSSAVMSRNTGMVTTAGPRKAGRGDALCLRSNLASSALSSFCASASKASYDMPALLHLARTASGMRCFMISHSGNTFSVNLRVLPRCHSVMGSVIAVRTAKARMNMDSACA